jgi:hypothetical protein
LDEFLEENQKTDEEIEQSPNFNKFMNESPNSRFTKLNVTTWKSTVLGENIKPLFRNVIEDSDDSDGDLSQNGFDELSK